MGVNFLTASSFLMILENENNIGLWTELMNFISADLDMNIVCVAFVKYIWLMFILDDLNSRVFFCFPSQYIYTVLYEPAKLSGRVNNLR